MRRFLLSICAIGAMLFAQAQETTPVVFTQDGLEFTVTGEGTVGLSDANDLPEVVIPETVTYEGTTYTVTSIMEDSFSYNYTTTKVVMPNSITEIEYCGMYGANAVTELQVSENLRTLGGFAFAYMRALPSITLPEGITEIPQSCFASAEKLAEIGLPSTIKSIGSGAFYKNGLTEFVFPASLETIGQNAFQGCASLKSVTFNSELTSMDEGVFRQCSALSALDMSAATKLQALPPFLFDACEALTGTVTIPAGVAILGTGVFGGTSVSEFAVADGNTSLTTIDGILYRADKSLLYMFPPKSSMTEVTVADGCLGINGGAFDGASSVTKVVLPETMRAFDDNAFLNCSSLTDINFPKSLVYMGAYALAGTGLGEVELPENMTVIYEGLLAQCPNLTKVTIPAAVEAIDMYAFRNCGSLVNVTCLGAEPAELNYYESYDYPFYNISSSAVLHVPSGTIDAYKSAGYGDGFSSIVDDMPGVFVPTSFTPADGSEQRSIERVLIAFPEAVTVAQRNPDVKFYKGDELTGTLIEPDDCWLATTDDTQTAVITALDYDGYTQAFSLDAGEEYTLVIPAGTFTNAAGDANQKITLHYVGYTPVTITYSTATPADGSELESLGTVELDFGESITSLSSYPRIVLRKGDATTGDVIEPDDSWMSRVSGQVLSVFPVDMDSYLTPITLEAGVDYYLTIPAGILRNSNGDQNAEIVLHYVGKKIDGVTDAIAGNCTVKVVGSEVQVNVGALEDCNVSLYGSLGQLLDAKENVSGTATFNLQSAGVVLVKVANGDVSRTFKAIVR